MAPAYIVVLGIVVVLGGIILVRGWQDHVRRAKVLWFIRGRVVAAFCAVYVLGAAPIGAHLFAVLANEQSSNKTGEFAPILIADVYLFAFIIALAGVVDALALSQGPAAIVFVVVALITGFGNYNLLLDVVVQHPIGNLLTIPAWAIFGVTAVGYAWFKGVSLYAVGVEDWEKAGKAAPARRGGGKP